MRRPSELANIALSAVLYTSIIFAFGFALGAVRTLWIAPWTGAPTAVLIEAPVILTISWWACRKSIRVLHEQANSRSRILMGAIAMALLLLMELAVSHFIFGRTFREHFGEYLTTQGILGLAAQLIFALFPFLDLDHQRRFPWMKRYGARS